jgi:putative transposase
MIDRTHTLPVTRQCQMLDLARSTVDYEPVLIALKDLSLMRRIDELHLEFPFAGVRMLRDVLRKEGDVIGRKRVRTVMQNMGIKALYPKPRTSERGPAHPIFPYLLRDLIIDRPNHVWAADMTYIPMRRGFVYLAAVMDWATRKVLSWQVSNTLTTDFCLDAVREAITRYGCPELFNTDQGSQFTSSDFTGLLKKHGIRISMDGQGCWRDNVFVERLWRSVKYEEVYLYTLGVGVMRYPRCWCDALTLGIVAWINWGSLLTLIGVDSHWLVDLFDFEAIELPASLEGL